MNPPYTRDQINSDILAWVNIVKQSHLEREKRELDVITEYVTGIEDRLPEFIVDTSLSEKELTRKFVAIYENFCARIVVNCENRRDRFVDSIIHITQILFIVDFGLGIMNSLLTSYYTSDEIVSDQMVKKAYEWNEKAYTIVSDKRKTILNLTNALDNAKFFANKSDKTSEKSYEEILGMKVAPQLLLYDPEEAYKGIKILGLDNKVSFEEFERRINSLDPDPHKINFDAVRKLVHIILEENNYAVSLSSNWTLDEVLQKLKQSIKGFEYTIQSNKEINVQHEDNHIQFYDTDLTICGESLKARISHNLGILSMYFNRIIGTKLNVKVFEFPNYVLNKDVQKLFILPVEKINEISLNEYTKFNPNDEEWDKKYPIQTKPPETS